MWKYSLFAFTYWGFLFFPNSSYAQLQKKIDVFYGVEESNCCCRCLCPRLHPYTMTITSGDGFTGGKVINTIQVFLGFNRNADLLFITHSFM
jgi:hypothetical protein